MNNIKDLKVAIVCDSLDQYGGAEKIVEAMHELFPDAPIYTSFYDKDKMEKHGFIDTDKNIITPKYGRNKLLIKYAKPLFFIYPLIFESFSFKDYDLVLSSSTRYSHDSITTIDTMHICYMHSPTRFAWDSDEYKKGIKVPFVLKPFLAQMISYLRVLDKEAADRVDFFIANSNYTRLRIRKFYRRDSIVINPFVDVKRFAGMQVKKDDYFLYVGRFIPWRKLEYVINCFNKNGLELRLVGNGDQAYLSKLKKMAAPNIIFYERQTDDEVTKHFMGAKALIWPSVEDFGIAPIEAQAAGVPVIALKKGGTVDSIVDNETGIFFDNQDERNLQEAITRFQKKKFDPQKCISNSQKFRKERFLRELESYIIKCMNENSISA